MILHVDKLHLYFLCSFCWYFLKIVWRFYFNEISNCRVFASLPVYSNLLVYYLWRFLPTSLFITVSLFINLAEICQHPRLFRPPLLFKTREYKGTIRGYNLKIRKTSTGAKQAAFIFFIFVFFSISDTLQKMKFSIKDFFSKCDQIRSKLRIWSHLLKKCLMENFIFMKTNKLFKSFKEE